MSAAPSKGSGGGGDEDRQGGRGKGPGGQQARRGSKVLQLVDRLLRGHAAPRAAEPPLAQPPRLRVGCEYELVPGRLFFAIHDSTEMTQRAIERAPQTFYFSSDFHESYEPFCADFGPVNLGVVHLFRAFMREHYSHAALQTRRLVYYCSPEMDFRSNCAFLLLAYMVIDLGYSPEEAWAPFGQLAAESFAPFRDATFCTSTYDLTVLGCLRGLRKAMDMGWYDPQTFNSDEYFYLDSPTTADMHVLSPKFVAFKGPSARSVQVMDKLCTFTPEHYSAVLKDKNVTAVLRLNKPETYDASRFTSKGFRHYDLYYDDCTAPSAAVVQKFFEVVEKEEGRVAVHCDAGLGRTGTLIALHFMKHHGWTAEECIGWLRIVRPGSVIGEQQQFLVWAQDHMFNNHDDSAIDPSESREGATRSGSFHGGQCRAVEEAAAVGKTVADAQRARAARAGGAGGQCTAPKEAVACAEEDCVGEKDGAWAGRTSGGGRRVQFAEGVKALQGPTRHNSLVGATSSSESVATAEITATSDGA